MKFIALRAITEITRRWVLWIEVDKAVGLSLSVTNLSRATIANGDIIKAYDGSDPETCLLRILLVLNFLLNLFSDFIFRNLFARSRNAILWSLI